MMYYGSPTPLNNIVFLLEARIKLMGEEEFSISLSYIYLPNAAHILFFSHTHSIKNVDITLIYLNKSLNYQVN